MKLKILFGILCGTLLFCVNKVESLPSNDWVKMKLKGKVKELIIDECLLTISKNDSNKICKVRQKFIFNSDGFILEKEIEQFSQLIEILKYEYDKNVLKKIYRYRNNDLLTSVSTFDYDNQGNRTKEQIVDVDKKPNSKYVYKYDHNGKKIGMIGYNMKKKGEQFITETFEYDKSGNLIKKTSGKRKEKYSYKLNDDKLILEKTITSIHANTSSTYKIEYTYDSNNKCIKEISTRGNLDIETNYQIDKIGNWINKKTKESKKRIISIERELKYY